MIYLDNAATSFPKPDAVVKRINEVLRRIGGNPGRGSHRMSVEAGRVVFSARESVASLFNIADSSRVVFTKNATEAINVVLKGLLKKGDHAITTSFEHNSVVRTLARLEREGVSVTKVSGKVPGLVVASDIEKAITPKTRLVVMVHASNVIGAIQPVRDIGRLLKKKGITFVVDAAQTAGVIPIDMDKDNMDVLIATGHKALFGPQGTGFFCLKEDIDFEPLLDGGTGEADVMLDVPDRFETGTINTPGVGGLGAGAEFVLKEGVKKIRLRETALIAQILDGFKRMPGIKVVGPRDAKERVSLVSFIVEGKTAVDVGAMLDADFAIMMRCGIHCAPDAHRNAGTFPHGTARVSPGYFNTHEEIEEFLKAMAGIVKG
ncbi:MAG TPA: aminotransferase class V-fold PLP-dependent enzyme [Thermodesulfobacteriota bacterium]|nr:aminotransferase class V-fold PLP-dependent enzyme [Thermodesulfobacteriota bacterium]